MTMNTVAWGMLICIASLSWLAAAMPTQGESREKRSPEPAHAMMVHSFLLRNPNGGYQNPQAGMSAFASRMYNSRTSLVNESPEAEPPAAEDKEGTAPEETPVEHTPEEEQEAPERTPKAEKAPAPAPNKPTRKVPKAPKRRPAEEEEEDDDDSYGTGRGSSAGGSTYSNFFPIVFGSRSTSNRRSGGDDDDAIQGPGLTAIANSFSTGRGAIAASHATAYGGPAPNPALRKGTPSRYRS